MRLFLIELRNVIHQAIPEAEETISWSVPAWKRKSSNVVRFSVNKDHIGLYIGIERDAPPLHTPRKEKVRCIKLSVVSHVKTPMRHEP